MTRISVDPADPGFLAWRSAPHGWEVWFNGVHISRRGQPWCDPATGFRRSPVTADESMGRVWFVIARPEEIDPVTGELRLRWLDGIVRLRLITVHAWPVADAEA